MGVYFYIGKSLREPSVIPNKGILLSDSIYWFLYRYFQSAKLPSTQGDLIDLYGRSELGGLQLEQFIEELKNAQLDISHKPDQFSVVCGWKGTRPNEESEFRLPLKTTRATQTIRELLVMAEDAQRQDLQLVYRGD